MAVEEGKTLKGLQNDMRSRVGSEHLYVEEVGTGNIYAYFNDNKRYVDLHRGHNFEHDGLFSDLATEIVSNPQLRDIGDKLIKNLERREKRKKAKPWESELLTDLRLLRDDAIKNNMYKKLKEEEKHAGNGSYEHESIRFAEMMEDMMRNKDFLFRVGGNKVDVYFLKGGVNKLLSIGSSLYKNPEVAMQLFIEEMKKLPEHSEYARRLESSLMDAE